MPTAVIAEVMRTLHRIHTQLSDLRGRIAAGPRQVSARTTHLESAEAARTAAQDAVKKAKVSADQRQLQLKTAEAKIRDLEGKLNACKTNREYQTLKEQIAADTMATKVLEDEILELLERVDESKRAVPPAEAAVEAARRSLDEARKTVAAEATELDGEVRRLQADLETTERELPADIRGIYDRAVKSKGADGLAALDGESCGGCFHKVTGNTHAELLMGRVVACRSCGRLLYLPEKTASG